MAAKVTRLKEKLAKVKEAMGKLAVYEKQIPYRSHVTAVVHEQAFRNTNAMAVHARSVISTIIRGESHWQSRVLRNDRH
jgi:hypothetical protein